MSSMSNKVIRCHDDFLACALPAGNNDYDDNNNGDLDLDMDDMFGDLGGGAGVAGFDPMGDASLDSFIDLSALLSEENAFLDPANIEAATVEMPDSMQYDAEPSTSTTTTTAPTSLKRKYDDMEAGSTIDFSMLKDCISINIITINNPAAATATATTTSTTAAAEATSPIVDHDYSSKRPRMSTPATEEPTRPANVFRFPTPPPPTPSATITSASLPGPSFVASNVPKEDKTRHRREKNNVASKRSREIRKQKFASMEGEAEQLIQDNARLELKVAQLEDLAKRMKEILVAKMAGK